MIGIILISHAHIASEMKAAVEHILGEQLFFEAVDIPNSNASAGEEEHFKSLLARMQGEHGVLVMADLYGATPCNIAVEAFQTSQSEMLNVIAGFNMPAVIKALTCRVQGLSLEDLAQASLDAGRQYLCLSSRCQTLQATTKENLG